MRTTRMAVCSQHDLRARAEITTQLYDDPHNPRIHLDRGRIHERLGFPDLAAADAYRALTLLESVVDPDGCEFRAGKRVRLYVEGTDDDNNGGGKNGNGGNGHFISTTQEEYDASIGDVYGLLVRSLVRCGCLRDAYEFCRRAMADNKPLNSGCHHENSGEKLYSGLAEQMEEIKLRWWHCRREQQPPSGSPEIRDHHDGDGLMGFHPSTLSSQGFARRVLYPWNEHEPDRHAPETLQLLNGRLRSVASKCEVRAVVLPSLHGRDSNSSSNGNSNGGVQGKRNGGLEAKGLSVQLGLFAKEDIEPGEVILRESSMLTATNRLHDDLCDACSSLLPELSSENPPVACGNCDEDTVFCSQACHDRAQDTYHRAVCGHEGLASIGKDIVDPKDGADYLYLLLLVRVMAMAETQNMHPLELPEVKYIWGDFHHLDTTPQSSTSSLGGLLLRAEAHALLLSESDPAATLPFSFQLNILQPARLLEEMGLDPFANLPRYDTWVLNTLYAKFRGTASGRLSTWDGGPEVCAVHPLWCLANHSCGPNVRWEWGGEIVFIARTASEKAVWRGKGTVLDRNGKPKEGIKKGEEILNHYCDIGLGVKERREWAVGALGGMCLCERCVWEESLTDS